MCERMRAEGKGERPATENYIGCPHNGAPVKSPSVKGGPPPVCLLSRSIDGRRPRRGEKQKQASGGGDTVDPATTPGVHCGAQGEALSGETANRLKMRYRARDPWCLARSRHCDMGVGSRTSEST